MKKQTNSSEDKPVPKNEKLSAREKLEKLVIAIAAACILALIVKVNLERLKNSTKASISSDYYGIPNENYCAIRFKVNFENVGNVKIKASKVVVRAWKRKFTLPSSRDSTILISNNEIVEEGDQILNKCYSISDTNCNSDSLLSPLVGNIPAGASAVQEFDVISTKEQDVWILFEAIIYSKRGILEKVYERKALCTDGK